MQFLLLYNLILWSLLDENFLLASANIVDSPIVYSSEGFTKMTGYRKCHVIKKKADCIFMCGYLTSKDSFRNLRATIKERKDAQLEILFYKKDGMCTS